jgi:hypothetical protein
VKGAGGQRHRPVENGRMTGPIPATPNRGIRFRQHGALAVAGLVAAVGALPVASSSWYLAPVVLIPLALVFWVLRSGTDADRSGLRVRALFGQRFIPWSEIEELAVDAHGRVVAVLPGHRSIRLNAVRPRDLPTLIEVGSQSAAPPPPAAPGPPSP